MTIGERIKRKRIELNMSQDELAKKVGYKSRSSIQKIEYARNLPLPKVEKMAVSEDGLIEAIGIKNHRFALAVQWHPEFSYEKNQDSMKLIEAFIKECK